MPPDINLIYVDRLRDLRRQVQGGRRGAPQVDDDGIRVGEEINRACVIMLSAALQAYIEDVYEECLKRKMGLTDEECAISKKAWERWGNPNKDNIKRLFKNFGVNNIFDGLSWQGANTKTIIENIEELNRKRNAIAHGRNERISADKINRWRNLMENFGRRFYTHCINKLNIE